MTYDVQWSYTSYEEPTSSSFATMIESEANEIYADRLAWLRMMKAKGMIKHFEICIVVCTKLVQE